jgi:hypothetical protein
MSSSFFVRQLGTGPRIFFAISRSTFSTFPGNVAPFDIPYAGRNKHLATRAVQVHFEGLSFSRTVEMYQWVEYKHCETEHTSHGGTREVCTYSYSAGMWVR